MQWFVALFGLALGATLSGAGEEGAVKVQDFFAHWGDGRAEISSYELVQPRYGELRRGYGVLIFVTEDINRNTLIKVESPRTSRRRPHLRPQAQQIAEISHRHL